MGERPIDIRPATTDDVPAITDITNALLATTTYEWTETPHTIQDRQAWLAEHQARGEPVLVAVDGDHVVGWAAYGDFRDTSRWPGYRFTVEHTIHTAESHQGRGIGRRLIEALAERARADGKRVMIAGVDGTNEGSVRFHESVGFRTVAHLPGVGEKFGRRLDLILLQLDLDDAAS
jgi:phosphinothricin acetyltransferase